MNRIASRAGVTVLIALLLIAGMGFFVAEYVSQIPFCTEPHPAPESGSFDKQPVYMSRGVWAERLCSSSAKELPDRQISYEYREHYYQQDYCPYPDRYMYRPVRHHKISSHHAIL